MHSYSLPMVFVLCEKTRIPAHSKTNIHVHENVQVPYLEEIKRTVFPLHQVFRLLHAVLKLFNKYTKTERLNQGMASACTGCIILLL